MSAIRPLFDFESVFDIDFTIIQMIQFKFKDSDFFNSVLYEDPITVRMLLREREDINPLSIILKDEYLESENQLYADLIKSYYKEIYRNISYTEISNFFTTLTVTDKEIINPMMVCRNKAEEFLARSLQFKLNHLTIIKPEDVKTTNFSAYFVKSIQSIEDNCPDIKYKTIFLLDYGFNVIHVLGKTLPKEDIFNTYGKENEIIISSVYSSLAYPEE